MYLSRIRLNRRRREAWRLLSSPQRLHAAVLASFPEPQGGRRADEGRVLWRLDADHEPVVLYVVSPDRPDFAHLAEQAGWPTTERGESKAYGPLLDRLATGQEWAFRLTANPTRYVRPTEGGRARRVAHVTAAQQQEWLLGKADAHGFAVPLGEHGEPDVVVTARETLAFTRNGVSGRVTISRAQFDGRLTVTDPDALRAALVGGIGAAKAYGCGLLTLAPVHRHG